MSSLMNIQHMRFSKAELDKMEIWREEKIEIAQMHYNVNRNIDKMNFRSYN